MHTVNNLYDKIADKENIRIAINIAARRKRKKRIVQKVLKNPEYYVQLIHEQLANETWRPRKVHNMKEINDGVQSKKREIVCPEFVNEQIVHHSIMNVCRPVFTKKFYEYSCASIPGRGTDTALKYIRKAVKSKKAKYFAVLDIRKFFSSLRPSVVFHELRRHIRDKRTLMLFTRILRSNKVKDSNNTVTKKKGVLLGFYTSPWFANIVLNPLDHLIKEMGVPFYVRYNDDMLLMHSNKRKLKKVLQFIVLWLHSKHLQEKNTPQIHKLKDVTIKYIGFSITPQKIVLQSKVFLKVKRTASRIHKKNKITLYDARRITSYSGRFKHVNAWKSFLRYVNNKVPIRKCRKIISERSRYDVAESI